MQKTLWITWERHRRSRGLAEAFGAKLLEIELSGRASRYLLSAIRTKWRLLCERPEVVFAQCPSLVLALLLVLWKPFFRYRLILDLHNAAVEPGNFFLAALSRFVCRYSDALIVTNSVLKNKLGEFATKTVILPDMLPSIGQSPESPLLKSLTRPVVTLIASFASDEPIGEFLEAVKHLPVPLTCLVTGRRRKAGRVLSYESDKIIFTDFLSHEDYDALIEHSDILVDLTTRDDCLVCGAYEAVAVGVPVLLSDTPVNRHLFVGSGEMSINATAAYQTALEKMLRHLDQYRAAAKTFRENFNIHWQGEFEAAKRELMIP